MKAVRVHNPGPPEALTYEDTSEPTPNENEVVVRLSSIGVNFTDVYTRSGLYSAKLPVTIGVEGSGSVTAVGPGVTSLRVGDTVSYSNSMGAYAEYAAVPESKVVKLPAGLSERVAAAVLLQGMTAHYLVNDTFRLGRDHTALIHAAAGGVGQLLVQVSKLVGARVIAATSTEEKAEVARDLGADSALVYSKDDFEAEVKRLTAGRGVDVVYDSVGRATFEKSLRCLRPRGYLALYGQSSGVVPPFSPSLLQKGSLFLTRPMLGDYTASHGELERRAMEVFGLVLSGRLRVSIFGTFPLSRAAEAHRLLESRRTMGKLLLTP